MNPSREHVESGADESLPRMQEAAPDCELMDFDVALLEESLSKTPWERMLANDDALRLADMLQAAMDTHRAKLK